MSYYVLGVASGKLDAETVRSCLKSAASACGLGYGDEQPEGLFDFPRDVLAWTQESEAVCFYISDGEGSNVAQFLLDACDYAEESDIGLPHKRNERLDFIGALVMSLMRGCGLDRLAIALTDSGYIYRRVHVRVDGFRDRIKADVEALNSPPDTLYVVLPAKKVEA